MHGSHCAGELGSRPRSRSSPVPGVSGMSPQGDLRACVQQVKLRSTPRSKSLTAPTEAASAADPADSSKDRSKQAQPSGETRANGAPGGAEEESATGGAVAAGWAAVDTWGGARTRSGRFARSPDKGTVSSGTDEATETVAPALVEAKATVPASAPRADLGQKQAIVPPLWQASAEPAETTTAVESPPAGASMRKAGGEVGHAEGDDKSEVLATGQRMPPTVDGWVAPPARSRPADPRPLIPRVATLAPGPTPAALARVAAERRSRQPPGSGPGLGSKQQAGGSTSRPASGSVARSPVAPTPPEFPGFSSPMRPTAPAAAVATQASVHPVPSPPRPAGSSPPSAIRPTAATASAASGAPPAGRPAAHKPGPAAVNPAPDPAMKFGYVYVPPPAPRPPRGLPRSPVRGMSSLDASGLRPVATEPVRIACLQF